MDFVVSIAIMYGSLWIFDRFLAARGYRGPRSDHFDGRYFYSYGDHSDKKRMRGTTRAFIRWMVRRPHNPWHWRKNKHAAVVPERVSGNELLVTFVNHSTVLIQTSGLNILTDPIWSKRTSPFPFIGPKRFRAPGIAFNDLPSIDVVLVSHNHYDHMDLPTLRRLAKRDAPMIIAGLGNAAYLRRSRIKNVHDVDWWQEKELSGGVKAVCVPGQHFSGRAISDRNRTLWCGFVLETPGGNIYFAGDTGYGHFVSHLAKRYRSFRLALLPIGAYRPEWFMGPVHISPDEALAMHRELSVGTSVAIHHATFKLADDRQDEPRARIRRLLSEVNGDVPDFRVLENGETIRVG